MEFKNVIDLANSTSKPKDEFNLENLSDDLKAALIEVMADDKKASAKAAAHEILAIVKDSRNKEAALVEEIRALRRKEVELKAALAKINTAREYATTTNNYIPLALLSGHTIPLMYRKAYPELMEVRTAAIVQGTAAL